MNRERYQRQIMLPEIGVEGQERLAESSVLVVGVGGLGSVVSTYLVAAGVGTVGLADSDVVSLSNLQRQILYSESQLGQPKTSCAARRLGALNSDVRLRLHPEGFTSANGSELVAQYDLVVDCCDNYPTRYAIDDACAAAGRLWVYGSIGRFIGQVAVFGGPSGHRYSHLYPERDALCAIGPSAGGVIGPVPGVVGAVQACQAIELLAGCGTPLIGRLFTIDLLTLNTNVLDL